MLVGRIDSNLEARLKLGLLVDGKPEEIEFIVDTGFNGFLSIPEKLVRAFGLELGEVQSGITADGRAGYFDTVKVQIDWFGKTRYLHAQVLDEPLIGTRLLRGHQLDARWLPGGDITLSAL